MSIKLSPYLTLELEVRGAGSLERITMSKREACEVRLMPTSILVSSDLCGEEGLTEAEALCRGAKHIYLVQESENLRVN